MLLTSSVPSITSKQCFELTPSVLSTTSKHCFEQPEASFLVCSLIFIEYKIDKKIPCHIRHGIFLFFKEKWWGEFFQFFKAFLSTFCIFTDDKTDIVTTEGSDSVREAQGINDRTKGLSKSRKGF